MKQKGWVLATGGGGRDHDALAVVRALAVVGYKPAVAVSEPLSVAAASRYCARAVPVPPTRDPDFAAAIRSEVERGDYLTVLPTSEETLLALGEKSELVDKVRLAEAARIAGFEVPPSREFSSVQKLRNAASTFSYPIVVKPTVRRYAPFRVDSAAQLEERTISESSVMVQPFLEEQMQVVSGVMWRGELVAAVHEQWLRSYPHPTGLACASETITPRPELEDRIVSLVGGYEGIFNVQFLGRYLIDVNLRVQSSHSMAVASGVNLVAIYCDLLRGETVNRVRGEPGKFYRWLEGDLRHLLTGMRSGRLSIKEALAALRPRRGAVHMVESLNDPMPMLVRLRYAGRRLRDSEGFAATGELR